MERRYSAVDKAMLSAGPKKAAQQFVDYFIGAEEDIAKAIDLLNAVANDFPRAFQQRFAQQVFISRLDLNLRVVPRNPHRWSAKDAYGVSGFKNPNLMLSLLSYAAYKDNAALAKLVLRMGARCDLYVDLETKGLYIEKRDGATQAIVASEEFKEVIKQHERYNPKKATTDLNRESMLELSRARSLDDLSDIDISDTSDLDETDKEFTKRDVGAKRLMHRGLVSYTCHASSAESKARQEKTKKIYRKLPNKGPRLKK